MCRALSNCRLYSWMRLIWLSKMVFGSTTWPVVALSQVGEALLGGLLGLTEARAKGRVVGQRQQSAQLAEVGHPAVADRLGDQSGQVRVGQQQPAARRHAVGLVVEPLGEQLGEVGDHAGAQQVGMDLGHAVGAVRADDGQVGHAHLAGWRLLDQAHPLHAVLVAGIALLRRRRGSGG